jgi:hypothetical protein
MLFSSTRTDSITILLGDVELMSLPQVCISGTGSRTFKNATPEEDEETQQLHAV